MNTNPTDEILSPADNAGSTSGVKRQVLIVAAMIVLIFCTATLVFLGRRDAELRAKETQHPNAQPPTAVTAAHDLPTPGATAPPPVVATEVAPANSVPGSQNNETPVVAEKAVAPVVATPEKLAPVTIGPPGDKKVVQDPFARTALSYIGIDGDAEAYWLAAIHDPTLPKSERQDLIDDLNEEGLPDPKHPTLDDLPLIISRIEIMDQIVPTLPEEIEWKESYDDLVNLAYLAVGGGKPVN